MKTRERYGEDNGCAKLTEQAVIAIRASSKTRVALAEEYGVDRRTIRRVAKREGWKHVP
jgi:hypothetical protein